MPRPGLFVLLATAGIAFAADLPREPLHFTIEGPGEIVATDNGDPTSFESFQSHDRKAFYGLCLVIFRGKAGQPGKLKLTAKAGDLEIGATSIETAAHGN